MNLERFSTGDSLLHRLDPRIKLVVAMVFSLYIATGQFFAALAGFFVGLFLILSARPPFGILFKRLLVVNVFVALLWLGLPLSYPGDILLQTDFFTLSRQGIELAALITLKSNAIILILISLLATSTMADLGHGLTGLGVPDKLCLLLLFSYRYIFVMQQEYQRLARSARLRNFVSATNMHSYKTYGNLFAMTLVKSWNRSHRVSQAMMLRGFHGRFYTLREQVICLRDYVFLAGMAAVLIGLFYLDMAL